MGIMPYHLEKGSFMIAMEDWLNAGLDPSHSLATARTTDAVKNRIIAYNALTGMLHDVAAGKSPRTIVELLAPLFTFANQKTAAEAATAGAAAPAPWDLKLGVYFMGLGIDGNHWTHPKEPSPGYGPTGPTGSLRNYFGNVERILGMTLARAIEASLGLPSIALDGSAQPQPAKAADAHWAWPIDCSLACESPWFEGWVIWKKHTPAADD